MFDSLSNLMERKQKQSKLGTSTITSDNSDDLTLNYLPTFNIVPVDFEIIDNQMLIDCLDRNEQ